MVVFIISRVPDQNGISQAWYIVKIYPSGQEPSICQWHKHTHNVAWGRSHTEKLCAFFVCWLDIWCQRQHAGVSLPWTCLDSCTGCYTETDIADQICYLTWSQYADTELTNLHNDPVPPDTWQGNHWSINCKVTGPTWPGKQEDNHHVCCSRGGRHTARANQSQHWTFMSAALEVDALPLGPTSPSTEPSCLLP